MNNFYEPFSALQEAESERKRLKGEYWIVQYEQNTYNRI